METTKVLIVDDHALLRAGLASLLQNEGDIAVVGEAGDGEEALRMVDETSPDIVLMDINMPGMSGIECIRKIKVNHPDMKIILLTMYEDENYLREGLKAGALGYVLKKAAHNVLYNAIRTVAAGEMFLPLSVTKLLLDDMKEGERKTKNIPSINAIKSLSDQESKVLKLIALGHTQAEIAQALNVSIKTVETYKYRVMDKLQAKKRSDLIRYAIDNGLIE
jgi:two-component system, NarL family, response regulator NreC